MVGSGYKPNVSSTCPAAFGMVTPLVCQRERVVTPCPLASGAYWEVDVMGSVQYPQGVRSIVASFEVLFGTPTGLSMLAWAEHFGWAVLWHKETAATHGVCADGRRILDLSPPETTVDKMFNTSFAPALIAHFKAVLAGATTDRANAS